MLNNGSPLTCVKSFPMVLILTIAVVGQTIADELALDKAQTHAIMLKTEVLEAEIQQRQQEAAVGAMESKEYQTGFEDGYNQAILDLLKSKLLNDPTLSPKPKGAGLHATSVTSSQQKALQQRDGTTPTPAVLASPTLSADVASSGSTSAAAPITAATTTIVTSITAAASPSLDQPASQQSQQPQQPQQPAMTARDWLQNSHTYLSEKNWEQAIEAATHAIALDSSLVDSYIVRTWAHAETNQSEQALEDIATAIRLDPKNALAYNNRAYVHELLNSPDKAQQDYQQACALGYQPACETVVKLKKVLEQQRQATINELTDRSYRQFQQQDWRGVVQTATELLVLDPESTVALVNRAGAYTELGKYTNALDDCNAALIVDPNMGIAYNNKGYVLELMGELKKAAMEYETACVLGVQQSCSDHKRLSQQVSVLD